MKKKILSIFVVLTMMLTLVPSMSLMVAAEETGARGYGEVITFNDSKTAFSPHFVLTTGNIGDEGWYAGMDDNPLVIETTSDNIVITAIDAVISKGGEYYFAARYNSGKKVETGDVENGTTVHVRNIYTNKLEINNYCGEYFAIDKITVYYAEISEGEEIVRNESNYAESEHFTITTRDSYIGGWYPGAFDDPVIIQAKTDNIVITAIEALIDDGAEFYGAAEYSSGEKVENGAVESGTTVHVNNIFSKRLVINSHGPEYFEFDKITIYYTEIGDGEVITYNQSTIAESDHFTITNNDPNIWCWNPGLGDYAIVVESKTDDIVITAIDAQVTSAGECYYAAEYSSGEKVETGPVGDDTTVHVKNIFSNRLEISSQIGQSFGIDKITVYYTHIHNYKDAVRDNGNGTHSFKCTFCDEYGLEVGHTWDDGRITTPSTETSEGVKNYTCTACGATRTDAIQKVIPYAYYTYDGTNVVSHEVGKCTEYKIITKETDAFEDGKWYVADGNITINNVITVTGEANLILCDGCTLNVAEGIVVTEGNALNIYGQSCDNGVLTANGGDGGAGIGSNKYGNCGDVTIYGGKINATGGENGAGIGGGHWANCGSITVWGGDITATGGKNGAGIGGGYQSSCEKLSVWGGIVTATGGDGGAGIGGGYQGNCECVHIIGGKVTAISGGFGRAIGAGYGGSSDGMVTVAKSMFIKGGENADRLAVISEVGAEKYIVIDNSLNPELVNATEGKAYAQKDRDSAIIRFMWKLKANEEANITNIGAYVIPFDKFYDIVTDNRTKSVQYANPTTSDGQALKSGNTFAIDVTNIPTAKYDTTIWAMPFINGSVIAHQLLNATVNGADINK